MLMSYKLSATNVHKSVRLENIHFKFLKYTSKCCVTKGLITLSRGVFN